MRIQWAAFHPRISLRDKHFTCLGPELLLETAIVVTSQFPNCNGLSNGKTALFIGLLKEPR